MLNPKRELLRNTRGITAFLNERERRIWAAEESCAIGYDR